MKNIRRTAVLMITLLLIVPLFSGCLGSSSKDLPKPDDRFYVYDEPDVLDGTLENHIISVNADLYEKCGAQVVVVCVKTTGSISTEKYAYKLFNEWGIGDKSKNNGILILLSIDEQDYWVLQGKGLEKTLQSGTLKLLLDDHLEPYFASGHYGVGVRELFDALITELEQIYSVSVSSSSSAAQENNSGSGAANAGGTDTSSKRKFTFITFISVVSVGIVAFTVIIIAIIIAVVIFIIIASLADAGFTGHTFRSSGISFGGGHRPTGGSANPYSSRGASHGSGSAFRPSSGGRSSGGFSFGGGRSGGSGAGRTSGGSHHSGGGGGSRGGGAGRR